MSAKAGHQHKDDLPCAMDRWLDEHGCSYGHYNRGKIEDLWTLAKWTDRKVWAILILLLTQTVVGDRVAQVVHAAAEAFLGR